MEHRLRVVVVLVVVVGGDVFVSAVAGGGGGGGRGRMADTVVGRGAVSGVVSVGLCGGDVWGPLVGARVCCSLCASSSSCVSHGVWNSFVCFLLPCGVVY